MLTKFITFLFGLALAFTSLVCLASARTLQGRSFLDCPQITPSAFMVYTAAVFLVAAVYFMVLAIVVRR